MKYRKIGTLIFILLVTLSTYAQQFNIFTIETRPIGLESKDANGFVSLSDIDRLGEHPDSLALPNLGNIDNNEYEKFSYIKLDSTYRTRFLSRTNTSETDKVFIYSYSEDVLFSIPVSDLKVVAWLNAYTMPRECPCPDYYYQIGFEIDNKYLKGLKDFDSNILVYIGEQNPFVRDQVEPIVWQEINSTEFPTNLISLEVNRNFGNNDFEYELGQAYKFEYKKYQVFIQKLIKKNDQFGLRLLIVDKETKEKRFEKLYYSGESASFAPLNYQWIGNLFKNKPTAIFGFQWYSFGCPIIDFIDFEEKPLVINCDNRH